MGFFGKVKSFFGGGAPTLSFSRVEDTIPVSDTGVKYNLDVTGKKDMTIVSTTSKLVAYWEEGEEEKELELAEEFDNGEHWLEEQNPFPGKIADGTTWSYAGSVFMDDDKNEELQQLYANKDSNKLKLMLEVEIDVKEIGGLFDPSIKQEITLNPPR
jgi:hypothetical protein